MNTPMAMGGSGRLETVTNPRDGENRPAILLVGASVRWAAQSLRRGLPNSRIIGLDWFGDFDTRMVCDQFHRFEMVKEPQGNLSGQIDSVAKMYDARVIRVGGLQVAGVGNPWQEWSQLQSIIRELTAESDCGKFPVTFPITYQCSAGQCCLAGATGDGMPSAELDAGNTGRSDRWLWKQTNSTGGMGIRRVSSANDSVSEPDDGWLQQRVHGRSYGLVAIAGANQTRVLGMTLGMHRRSGDRPFIHSGSRGPVFAFGDSGSVDVPWRSLQALCERVAQQFSLRGLFNLDFIRDAMGRWWLLELNARPSASCEVIERWATEVGKLDPGHSLMRMHLDAFDGRDQMDLMDCQSNHDPLPLAKNSAQWIKRIVFANRDVSVDVEQIQRQLRAESIAVDLADLPSSSPTFVAAEEPILTLLIRFDDRERKMAATQLRRAIRIVKGAR
ncbi:ATP-grasp domain-containing protein [Rhodopirellula bahusiensis]|uniref:ATP-grasp domain-containing protein n=1 Tax=Rhodopirellula bahusiensis TaxID=2014065 RepID=UPI0032644910